MPMVGALIQGQPVRFDDIPPEVMAPEIIGEIQEGNHRPGIHLTDLTGCPHDAVRRHRYAYYTPIEAIYRMVRGKGWDRVFGANPRPGFDYQKRIKASIFGVEVTGSLDRDSDSEIADTKAPAVLKGYEEVPIYYTRQLNGYRWLKYKATGVLVPKLTLLVCAHFGYKEMDVPLLDIDEWGAELENRLTNLLDVMAKPDVVARCGNDKDGPKGSGQKKCFCYGEDYWDYSERTQFDLSSIGLEAAHHEDDLDHFQPDEEVLEELTLGGTRW